LTILKLLVQISLIAVGLALLRLDAGFGLGVFWLAFCPLAAYLMSGERGRKRKLRWVLLAICMLPPYAVSVGPYIAVQKAVWGFSGPPAWFRSIEDIYYRPLEEFMHTTRAGRMYYMRFQSTWQTTGLWLGRALSIHDVGGGTPEWKQRVTRTNLLFIMSSGLTIAAGGFVMFSSMRRRRRHTPEPVEQPDP
jgi:hypothetical protein